MGATTGAVRRRVAASPNYRDGEFRSHEPTHVVVTAEAEGPGSVLATMVRERGRGKPGGAVPLVTPRHPAEPAELAVTWYGHATSVVELDGRRFLLDPVFGDRVSPSMLVGPKRMHPVPGGIAEIPRLDAVVISHDHYDHLDEPSIKQLERSHRPHYVVPLGVDEHLRAWGVPAARVTTLDWREETEVAGIRITCCEARHFSGRGFVRNQTLWAAWALRGPHHAVFFGGDSGPTHRYADIGADLGPFDLTIIPIGAYSVHWPDIHLNPEQAIEAHLDVNKGETDSVLLPIHWATFNLATHWWSEPIRWARRAAAERGVRLVAPKVGTRIDLSGNDVDEVVTSHQEPWWKACAADGDRD
ncbi:MBL fold metallo-hydrolase [Terrabacter sp. MAHUQ-38]|uniref:MBL fold metallo-hydrolase n=1 Tax=unclassified Terrabacter TaxID=2630222 RepID=UPI00165D419B|nr:MBL fold metallo-hydrolase [Terrabacter sp. MAHUQ-38]MBC9820846.1 MBL fold metallo-hydrolase [Terrabacter sp. MAHUQ-38]